MSDDELLGEWDRDLYLEEMMFSRFAILTGAFCVLGASSPLSAQLEEPPGEGVCGIRCGAGDCCPDNEHMWTVDIENGTRTGNSTHECTAQYGAGGHGSCSPEGDPMVRAAFLDILAAAKARDVTKMLTIALRAPDFIVVNRDRGTVMLRSCRGTGFIANLQYSGDKSVMALASKLETLQAMRARHAAKVAALASSVGL